MLAARGDRDVGASMPLTPINLPAQQERESGEAASTLVAGTVAALEALYRQLNHDPLAQSALRHARQTLDLLERNSEAIATRYRSLIDAVPDAVTLHEENGRILEANAAAAQIYGYSQDQLRNMSVYDLNPDLPRQHMAEVMDTFQLGRTVTVETTNRRGDGTLFPVEVHSNLYIDGDQRRIVAVARDISRRHEADAELRASEQRYRALLHAMDKGVLVQDSEGRIVSVNPAGCRILGLSEAELLAVKRETLHDWHFEDESGTPLPFDQLPGMRALASGKIVENMLIGVYLPHLHVYRWISIGSVPQFATGQTQVLHVISTFSDVSAFRRAGELFAQTQALASIGGWEYDFLTGALFWTEEMYRIHDLPQGSVINAERAQSFYNKSDLVRIQEAQRRAREYGEAFDLEVRLTSAIGRRGWVRLLGQPQRRHDKAIGLSGTLQDITERKLQEEQLRRQAQTDSLTGLTNRDTMLTAIDIAIASARAGRGPALLFIDLDRFKIVNDMLGHAAGDRILALAAERLVQCADAEAMAARFGADEFLLLLPECDEALMQRLAERITAAFAQPFAYAGEEFAVTVSVGIARFPIDGATAQQLVNHADAAMVEAKRRGRNTWQAFTPQLARTLGDRLLIESQLRRALDNGEFRLEYQPTIDLSNNRVLGAEALLRWHNHQLGELGPALFIGHAENSGDIVRIGAWVIREACRQIRRWRNQGLALKRVSVNVSYRQFLSERLAETVNAALREFDLPGEVLELEMTERVLIEDVPDTLATLATLRGLGVTLTIDDFGEGYSALNYLRRLPVDGIKISHSFMQGIPGNATDTAICEAIVRMARSLGLVVTAEGVEHAAQRDFLVELGTPLAQGFLYSRSLAPDRFAAFCENWNRTGR